MSDVQLSKGEAMDLACRAVACKAWRWMGGMLPLFLDDEGDWCADTRIDLYQPEMSRPAWVGALPDLTDPATLGCLLALVREVWGEGGRLWQGDGGTWVMEIGTVAKCGDTEAEALVRALEAAP